MKPVACAALTFFAGLGVLAACSSTPSQPPVDTAGTTAGAGGSSSVGAGTHASSANDAGTNVFGASDAADDALSSCLVAGGCLGCCTADNVCEPGNLNAACGVEGVRCQTCVGQLQCISGGCE